MSLEFVQNWKAGLTGIKKKGAKPYATKKRIKQTPSTSKFKGLNSSQLRKLQKEN
jgi:ABC-type metal ion transport system substrate-binding protein